MESILTIVIGLLLRIGLPLGVSALVFLLLRRLDERWQKEALAIPVLSYQTPCWKSKDCSKEKKENCQAFIQANTPCWQVFRTKNGLLQEKCLGCDVFRLAPDPANA